MDFINSHNKRYMEIRTEKRNEKPVPVENIGLGAWHVRWNILAKVEDKTELTYYEYKEVTLDHEPSTAEIRAIKAL